MGLFGFGKKKEEKPACACQCGCPAAEANETEMKQACCCANKEASIKVLGTGCASCHALLENTKQAVQNMGISVEVEYVQDMEKIAGYGVMSVPALVVNEKAVSMGKVLKTAEVETMLKKLGF